MGMWMIEGAGREQTMEVAAVQVRLLRRRTFVTEPNTRFAAVEIDADGQRGLSSHFRVRDRARSGRPTIPSMRSFRKAKL
jgi:hypothetical protein